MLSKTIINTENEINSLIPDKWILGTGLSTNSLYITHTDKPLMIVQYPMDEDNREEAACTVYIKGKIKPKILNQLFAEAWELIEIYKTRFDDLGIDTKDSPKSVT